jgi:hypothetical protein
MVIFLYRYLISRILLVRCCNCFYRAAAQTANYFWCGQAATQKTGIASAKLEKTAALSKNIIQDFYVFLVNIAAKCHETFLKTISISVH